MKPKMSKSISDLAFHPSFNQKKTGDIILQSDSDTNQVCFYFRLAHLAELSTFFSSLPTPSAADLVDGTAVIPLPHVSSSGMLIALSALRSTVNPDGFEFDITQLGEERGMKVTHIINAAVFAKIYDVPLIFSMLLHLIHDNGLPHLYPFLIFAIRAISSGSHSKLSAAAEATLGSDITAITPSIVSALEAHASSEWSLLRDLHLRHACGPVRFATIRVTPQDMPSCGCRGGVYLAAEQAAQVFANCSSAEEARERLDGSLGIKCGGCTNYLTQAYRERALWFVACSREYMCSDEDRMRGVVY